MRTHVVLPDDLVAAIDGLVGPGKRSRFIEDAVKEQVRKQRLLKAIDESFGTVNGIPEWETSESTAQWVHDTRQQDTKTRMDRLKRD